MRVADLCSGSGSATRPFIQNGHIVDCFDLPDGDITKLTFKPGQYDFIWCSPPCTDYAKLDFPWFKVAEIDLSLWEHCLRLINEAKPFRYVIENVKGAQKVWGKADHNCGSFFFWGNMLNWPKGHFYKNINSIRDPKKRAIIPKKLATQFAYLFDMEYRVQSKLDQFFNIKVSFNNSPPRTFPLETSQNP